MKRVKPIAIWVIICALFLCGCHPLTTWVAHLSHNKIDAYKYQSEYADKWLFQQLATEEQRYYGYIYTAVTDTRDEETYVTITDDQAASVKTYGTRVTIPDAKLSKSDIQRLYEAFFSDNPQFFYLDRTYSMEGYQNISGETYYNTLILQYTASAEQRSRANRELTDAVDTIFLDIPSEDEYEIERYLHDRLTANCTYDVQVATSESSDTTNAYTAFGALVEGKAVCEGYAKAMQLLLQKAAIPVTLVTGTAKENNESHMWNMVTINGENYHLDPTWDDSNDQKLYTFFNLTTDMVSESCVIDHIDTLPSCTATKDNPFVRNGTVIDTYERQVIAQIIADRVVAGETTIQLRFTEGKFENGVLFLKNKSLMDSMVNKCLKDYGATMWEYELWAEQGQRVLTLIQK